MTPKEFPHAHAHVLGALLGRDDPDLTREVKTPVASSRVMYAGLDAWLPVEGEIINELGLRRVGADALRDSSSPVLEWIADQGICPARDSFRS
jgi:arginase